MTPDQDRLCVAASLLRQWVSVVAVRAAIEARDSNAFNTTVTEILVTRGALSPDDKEIFQRLLEERLSNAKDRHIEFHSLLDRRVQEALAVVDDPFVRSFLRGGSSTVEALGIHSSASYRLIQVHSEGGLGQIWLAAEDDTRRQVAIKRIMPHVRLDPEPRRRFVQEAQITGQLQHPNIVPIYHLGTSIEKGEPFYAMPFIRGRTLDAVIEEFHRDLGNDLLDPGRLNSLLSTFLKVCDAVAYANSTGVVHRDLKPANIMVGTFGEVFVLDWGLAKSLTSESGDSDDSSSGAETSDETATQHGVVLGSPLYMAPEQAAGRIAQIDFRTDVYGLGAVLFKMLTGREPHPRREGDSLADHLTRILNEPVSSARQVSSKVPPALAAICAKALSFDPKDRYLTASEIAEDIGRWLVGDPVSVFRESASQTLARWALRHRRWTSLGAALVALIVITTAAVFASVWAYSQATMQQEVRALELHSIQAVESIQGDVDWAFRDAMSLTGRMKFVELLVQQKAGNTVAEGEWKRIYVPILEDFLRTSNYFYEVSLFSSAEDADPEFRFHHPPDKEKDQLPNLFVDGYRPVILSALAELAKLKPGEKWCSALLLVQPGPHATPLPVLLGGTTMFADEKPIGYFLAMIDFRVPLEYLAANKRLSEAITITDEEGKPFFHDDSDAVLHPRESYANIPQLPPRVVDFLRLGSGQESHFDFPSPDDRRLICARKSSCLPDREKPYVGVVLEADYDELMTEPMQLRRWVAGITLGVVMALMVVGWTVVRVITLLARG